MMQGMSDSTLRKLASVPCWVGGLAMIGVGAFYVAGGSNGEPPDLSPFAVVKSATGSISSSSVILFSTNHVESLEPLKVIAERPSPERVSGGAAALVEFYRQLDSKA